MSSYRIITLSGSDPALEPYLPMIYSDFMRSLRYGNDWFALIDSDRYFAVYKQVINRLLEKLETVVRLAVLSDDLDTCLGWSLSEKHKLHYVFVKKDYWRQGIGSCLLPREFTEVTHLTKLGKIFRNKMFRKTVFDPFIQ